MNSWLLTLSLCLLLILYLSGLTYFIFSFSSLTPSSFPFNSSQSSQQQQQPISPGSGSRSERQFCSLSDLELNSLIWSHRGSAHSPSHHMNHHFDASIQSMAYLLSQGITNYDIDVSLQISSPFNSTSPNFIVAHPVALETSPNLPFQTIRSFLDQISEHFPHPLSNLTTKYLYPFVTVEPKFQNLEILSQLLNEVMKTSLGSSGHVAIIVKDEIHLREVENWYSKHQISSSQRRVQPIAIAYRSQNPLGERNYLWTRTSSHGLPPKYVSSESSSSDHSLSFQQIHMPDVQLLRSKEEIELSLKKKQGYPLPLPFQSDQYQRKETESSDHRIVSWIVDQEKLMWEVFQDSTADMIITNQPVQLLTTLRGRYRDLC